MEALILTCSTGGGHNSAARAVAEELQRRGWRARILDPYSLAGEDTAHAVGSAYTVTAQHAPHLFGAAYHLGALYSHLPVRSPVYAINLAMVPVLAAYLEKKPCDIIVSTHLFPGEILTAMRRRGMATPPLVFVATDDTCIPFTGECTFDAYCIPAESLWSEFVSARIPEEKLVVTGIPVARAFCEPVPRTQAREALGLGSDERLLLMAGGSIGAGGLYRLLGALVRYVCREENTRAIVLCGSNRALYSMLSRTYSDEAQLTVLTATDQMPLYLRACDVYLSKPGGLSSAEAAVMGVPLIHLPPIPGCETRNRRFYTAHGMSMAADSEDSLVRALEMLKSPAVCDNMRACQKRFCAPHAAQNIAALCESLATAG